MIVDKTIIIGGIDDFSKRKRHNYASVLVNHLTRKIIDVLDSREAKDVTNWIKQFPQLTILTRDGSYTYDKAITDANPKIIQILDRFHLLKNVTDEAIEKLKKYIPKTIKIDLSENIIEDKKINYSDLNDKQKAKYDKKKQIFKSIKKRYDECKNYSKVAREFNVCNRLVKKYVNLDDLPITTRNQIRELDKYKDLIIKNIDKKITDIYKILCENGYKKTYGALKHYIKVNNFKNEKTKRKNVFLDRTKILNLLYNNSISEIASDADECEIIKIYLKNNPDVQEIINIVTTFRIALFDSNPEKFERWYNKIKNNNPYSFSLKHIEQEYEAIINSIIYKDFTNGLIEGKNNKIKNIKRSMYGRCSFELLRLKVLATP